MTAESPDARAVPTGAHIGHFAFLRLHFLSCEMGMFLTPSSQNYDEDGSVDTLARSAFCIVKSIKSRCGGQHLQFCLSGLHNQILSQHTHTHTTLIYQITHQPTRNQASIEKPQTQFQDHREQNLSLRIREYQEENTCILNYTSLG